MPAGLTLRRRWRSGGGWRRPTEPGQLAWPASPGSGGRRLRRRPAATLGIDRARQAHVIAVRIGHDREAATPEGVERRLAARVSGRGQLGVAVVNRLPAR